MNFKGFVYSRNRENLSHPLMAENWLGKLPAYEGKITAPWMKTTLGSLIRRLEDGNFLLIYEYSDLGKNLEEAIEILAELSERGVFLYIVSESVFVVRQGQLSVPGFPGGQILETIELCLRLANRDRERRSALVKAGQKRAGTRNRKINRAKRKYTSRLDKDRDEIIKLFKSGATQLYLAREYGVSVSTMHAWINKHARGR